MPFQYTNPKFDPPTHGFHFNNASIPYSIGRRMYDDYQLCGGVVYAALDYFYNGRPIPATTEPPPRYSPLNDYIFMRQAAAHVQTLPRLAGGRLLSLLDKNQRFVQSLTDEYNQIRHSILVSNRPVPLFLIKAHETKGLGHHVLVIGCLNHPSEAATSAPNLPKPVLKIYDPNAPNIESEILVDYANKRFQLRDMKLAGFFVDHNYSQMPANKLPTEPPAPVPPGGGPVPPAPGPTPPTPPRPAPPLPGPPTPSLAKYIVKGGDTLSRIAAVHYGNSNLWPKIYQANQTVIGPNPNLIRIGQVLTIPA